MHINVVDIIHVADMDETYGTYVDDECFGNHDYNDDADHDTDHGTDDDVDDDPTYDIDDDTDDGGSGNLYSIEVPSSFFFNIPKAVPLLI